MQSRVSEEKIRAAVAAVCQAAEVGASAACACGRRSKRYAEEAYQVIHYYGMAEVGKAVGEMVARYFDLDEGGRST